MHEKLSWQPHVDVVSSKCYAVIASLRRLRQVGIPTEGLLLVYRTLLIPILSYCVSVWGGGYSNVESRTQVIQNDALRAITGRSRRESVSDVYSSYGLLTVRGLHRLSVAILGFKMTNGRIPAEISFPLTPISSRSSRRATSFCVPLVVKNSSRHALAYTLPKVWGSLPHEIRSLTSAKKFSREVTKVLLRDTMIT